MTLLLWFTSFVVIAASFHLTKDRLNAKSPMVKILRFVFCILTGLSFWGLSTYSLWLMGFELEIGTVKDGKMDIHWWLPPSTLLWTVATYYFAKNLKEKE